MHHKKSFAIRAQLLLIASLTASSVFATPSFLGVAAGDTTADSVIIWTRATDGNTAASNLTAEISTSSDFSNITQTINGLSARDASRDFTLKQSVSGLTSGTDYFYRFKATDGSTSAIGSFKTAPDANSTTSVKFGFSGDADGLMRPYTSAKDFAKQDRDFFVFLGDTIYETASKGSAAAAVPALGATPGNLNAVLNDYHRKYREQFQGVNSATGAPSSSGQQGLSDLYAAQGIYPLLDNHELGNKQYINGGAPIAALSLSGNGAKATDLVAGQTMDHNTTGTYVNQSAGYKTFVQAYSDYQPISETLVNAPTDARSNGTQQLYKQQDWGKNLSYISTDDRSYRDVRLKTASGADDTPTSGSNSNRWADPQRTMLGTTQLGWLENSLLDAQHNGQVWKFVSVSSPIDEAGNDGGKSWYGGYQAERNSLLKFIDENHIQNVVFISTDDHFSRVSELWYNDNGTQKRLNSAFSIVTGPIGATGPDGVTNHSFSNILNLSNAETNLLTAENLWLNGGQAGNQLGLKDFGSRISNLKRDHDGILFNGSVDDAVNFYSPDTFAYANLDIDSNGRLHVDIKGIDSYAVNTFPQNSPELRTIFSFDIIPVPETSSLALLMAGLIGIFGLRRKSKAN